jgi:predicted membrane protein
MREHHHRPGLWPGFLLISLGLGLLARELGMLPVRVGVMDFWPLFVVMIGISLLRRATGLFSALLALTFAAAGAMLLAGNLGFVTSSVTRLWPVLLVLLGLSGLFRRKGSTGDLPPPPPATLGSETGELELTPEEDHLDRQFTCAGAQLRVESQAWKGGHIAVTAGGVELDLRQAQLDPRGAVLTLRVLMGGVDIRVPDTWQVHCDVMPLLGGADDSTRSTQGATSAPRLRIIGNVTLGGVSVQN